MFLGICKTEEKSVSYEEVVYIEGACSNQVVKCIIYTSDINIGREKLLEIEKEKYYEGISVTRKVLSRLFSEIDFSDGEEWKIVNPIDTARGYRWRKAWVDTKNTSIAALYQLILPCGSLYQWKKEKYFNW